MVENTVTGLFMHVEYLKIFVVFHPNSTALQFFTMCLFSVPSTCAKVQGAVGTESFTVQSDTEKTAHKIQR